MLWTDEDGDFDTAQRNCSLVHFYVRVISDHAILTRPPVAALFNSPQGGGPDPECQTLIVFGAYENGIVDRKYLATLLESYENI